MTHAPNITSSVRDRQLTVVFFVMLAIVGSGLAYIDHQLGWHTILVEAVHATGIFALWLACLWVQRRYPDMHQYGWTTIVWGVFCLLVGSLVDMLDNPNTLHVLHIYGIPFGRSWQQAFLKKILGYTIGVGLIALGLSRWVPWMVRTRHHAEAQTLHLARVLIEKDQVEDSIKQHLSRELHDDIAQRLTAHKMQLQLLQRKPAEAITPETFQVLGQEVSETLKSVRRLSQDIRPEALFDIGLLPAVEQWLSKQQRLFPTLAFHCQPANVPEAPPLDSLLQADPTHTLHVFRMVQELVHNAIKHSKATTICVVPQWCAEAHTWQIIVRDNGQGLPWLAVPSSTELLQQGHLGLVGLQERAQAIGATITWLPCPAPETGLAATVTLKPLERLETPIEKAFFPHVAT